ncbi:EscD/YscD/HrpQ family type III secretion system periplasmic domain-containing protein [Mesorhizobium sp.]|uniref:SctD/MshK family protein n=1 Tax=Mesorhizobium sp. TaxID=1871066 RepID=UPI00345CBD71
MWYGERPYVIATDGARYHQGAFTNDGWTVKRIGETELLLTKGGATVALKYP